MKKLIGAFMAGQALQLLLLLVAQSITYSTNLLMFCAIIGTLAALMLVLGAALAAVENAIEDIEEAPPIPEDIVVSNDKVKRAEDLYKAVEASQRRTARAVEEVR